MFRFFKQARAAQPIIDRLVVRSQQRGFTVTSHHTGSCVILRSGGAEYSFFDLMSWLNFLRVGTDCEQSGNYEHDAFIDELVRRSTVLRFNISQDIRTRDIVLKHQYMPLVGHRVKTLEEWENYLNTIAQSLRVGQ